MTIPLSLEMLFVFGITLLMIGAAVGVIAMSLCAVAKQADTTSEIMRRQSEQRWKCEPGSEEGTCGK